MTLAESDQRLLRLFVAAVIGRFDEVVRVRRAAGPGEPDRRWREAVLQVHVFAGFPRLVELYSVLDSAGGLGVADADEMEDADLDDGSGHRANARDEVVRARGRALFEQIYRDDAGAVRAMLARHHGDFALWIERHAYGRVLARPGLAADRRELLAVAALSALGQDRQLASHVRGALRCGATRAEIDAALDCVGNLIERDRIERARRVVERFG
jgi:alkylhydroperoxidase/carboxymuconolactone decarboxylase family protein YurZ